MNFKDLVHRERNDAVDRECDENIANGVGGWLILAGREQFDHISHKGRYGRATTPKPCSDGRCDEVRELLVVG